MMKNKIYPLASLLCFSLCFVGAVQADVDTVVGCPTGVCDDVVFSPVNFIFPNVTCGLTNRAIAYRLNNNQANGITLNNVKVTNQPGLPLDTSGATIVPAASGCITSVTSSGVGNGFIAGSTPTTPGTCILTLNVSTPACTNGPVLAPITRQLFIGVQSQQGSLTGNINANISVLGSAESFALLSNTVTNTSQGTSQVSGNIGSTTALVAGSFNITNGAAYLNATSTATSAQTDFATAYASILNLLPIATAGCNPLTSMKGGEVIYSGSYCLQPPPSQTVKTYFSVGDIGGATQPIILSGSGNFYFFVDSLNTGTRPSSTLTACQNTVAPTNYRCDLQVQPNVSFEYTNGASSKNVYWIMGNPLSTGLVPAPTYQTGKVLLGTNARLDGTVLNGATVIPALAIVAAASTSPTLVNGRLWVLSTAAGAAISLYGNTVALPSTLSMLEGFEEGESVWY